jgi:hypothetical protein
VLAQGRPIRRALGLLRAGPFGALNAAQGGPLTSHVSLLTSHGLLASVMFELIDDDGADDDAAFDDLLPVSGNVGQVEDVV